MFARRLQDNHPLGQAIGRSIFALALPVMLLASVWQARPSHAQSLFQWINTSGAFYDIGSNWSPTGPPASIDVAQFLQNATYEARWDGFTATATPDVGFVDIGTGSVTFQNQNSTQHSFTINEDLTLFDATQLTNSGLNLNVVGSTFILGDATLLIDGSDPAGSQFNTSGHVLIPDGSMIIDNGAIGDLDTVQLNVDLAGPATFDVLGGSDVTVERFRIGDGASQPVGSSGFLNVSGTDSTLRVIDPNNVFFGNGAGLGLHVIDVTDGAGMLFDDEAIVRIEKSCQLNVSGGFFGNEFLGVFDDLSMNISGGELVIDDGGSVLSSSGDVVGGGSEVLIAGDGSHWTTMGSFQVRGPAIVTIIEGGQLLNDGTAFVARLTGSSNATVTVQDPGSRWEADFLEVGFDETGLLNVVSGGVVTSGVGRIGANSEANGTVNVFLGGFWSTQVLVVGGNGQGTLSVGSGGSVAVDSSTNINTQSVVNLSGGGFEFGSTDYDDLTRVNATGGAMAGVVDLAGVNDIASLSALQNAAVDLQNVVANNSDLLYGSAFLGCALSNEPGGELRTSALDWARFDGIGSVNHGVINNFGGIVEFAQDLTNQLNGFIGGRGLFVAEGGWNNAGVMAFSGTTDILGDIENLPGGLVVTSGGATTTFFDDLVHNGDEIRTSENSSTVIFGQLSGAGTFTGAGTVYLEGDLRPGNSPDMVAFEGSLILGPAAESVFEIAGGEDNLFDRLLVDGNLSLDGSLSVELIDGFQLGPNQQFLVAEVAGNLTGQFDGLAEGNLVGTFSGQDVFISYAAGDGNDVALYTATPSTRLGDVNLDGAVNLLDVDPFVDRIATGTYQAEADCNQDGIVNLLDVNAFVSILSGN